MKELCIPIPHFGEDQIAEVSVTVAGNKMNFHFRVESFPWELDDSNSQPLSDSEISLAKITILKSAIINYDKDWELIQIFTPVENAKRIQILYRKKM